MRMVSLEAVLYKNMECKIACATVSRIPHDIESTANEREQGHEGMLLNLGNRDARLFGPSEHTTLWRELVLLSYVVSCVACRRKGVLGSDSEYGVVSGNGLPCQGLHKNLHATTKAKHKVQHGLLLDVVVGQCAAGRSSGLGSKVTKKEAAVRHLSARMGAPGQKQRPWTWTNGRERWQCGGRWVCKKGVLAQYPDRDNQEAAHQTMHHNEGNRTDIQAVRTDAGRMKNCRRNGPKQT